MLNLLNPIRRYVAITVAIVATLSIITALVQTKRASRYQEKIELLSSEVDALKRAHVLVEQLRSENDKVIEGRESVLKGLKNAEGYDTVLPFGISDLLDGVR